MMSEFLLEVDTRRIKNAQDYRYLLSVAQVTISHKKNDN